MSSLDPETAAQLAAEAANEHQEDPNNCPHGGGAGASNDQPDGCSGCKGSGRRQRGYWNNYGRDWDDPDN